MTNYKNIISSALLFGFFQFPLLSTKPADVLVTPLATSPISTSVLALNTVPISKLFLGDVSSSTASSLIGKQVDLITTRSVYNDSLAVIKKHEAAIRQTARELGVPEDVALGVAMLENGGSETAVSKAGALGVFQLMPGTARALGLTVTKKVDDRRDPEKNIKAGITYLKENYDRFGDWGLATWAYHAGEGNVGKALTLYARAASGISFAQGNWGAMKQYVLSRGLTVHTLLSSAAVQPLTKKLADDSSGYPYKVLATAYLFKNK